MTRCWSCSTKQEVTMGDLFICKTCEDILGQIHSLEKVERNKLSRIDDLIHIQRKGFDSLIEGIQGIASTLEWGFSELSWELQQQTNILREIAMILKTPSEIKANEWRQMGEELRRRRVYDEAIEFLLKSLETNPLDYRTYVGLGEAYLCIGKFDDAKKYFEKSLPHAPAEFYKSYSLRLIGRIYYCREDYNHAIRLLNEAVDVSPTFIQARYDLAQYYAVKGDAKKSLPLLRVVVEMNSFYFYLSEKEGNFDPIRREVSKLQEEMTEEVYGNTQVEISKAKNILKDAEDFWEQFYTIEEDRPIRSQLNLAVKKVSSNDYEAILEAEEIAIDICDTAMIAKDKAPLVEELLKKLEEDKQQEYKELNTPIALHALSISSFAIFIAGYSITNNLYFLLFILLAWVLEAWAEVRNPTIQGDAGWGFWLAPLSSIVFLDEPISLRRQIEKSYQERYQNRLEEVATIEGFW